MKSQLKQERKARPMVQNKALHRSSASSVLWLFPVATHSHAWAVLL